VLKPDRPRTLVPGKHVGSQPAPDPLAAHCRGNPESRYRPPIAGKPLDDREPHWRVLAGIGMGPPGQVPRPVRRGKPLQRSCLVPAIGVREPVDDEGQVMPEHLPEPGHDHPLVIRHGTDGERTPSAGLAGSVCTRASHPPSLTRRAAPAWLSAVACQMVTFSGAKVGLFRHPSVAGLARVIRR
jgi:hypothetical protein